MGQALQWRRFSGAIVAGAIAAISSAAVPCGIAAAQSAPDTSGAKRAPDDPDDTLANLRDDRGTRLAPLLSVGRAQYCLKDLGYYDRTVHGRPTAATLRALRSFQSDNGIQWRRDVLHDHELHVELWDQCRETWQDEVAKAKARLKLTASRRPRPDLAGRAQAEKEDLAKLKAMRVTPGGGFRSPAPFCLPDDLRQVLVRAHGSRGGAVKSCDLPCLPRPAGVKRADDAVYESRWGIRWCLSCIKLNSYLPLADIETIERAGNVKLCGVPRALPGLRREMTGEIIQNSALRLRGVMNLGGGPAQRHDDIAVLIANSDYRGHLPAKASAIGDIAVVHALLSEKLGYRASNIIELRNAGRAELEALFGRRDAPSGRLMSRLKAAPKANLLVYISAYGAISGADGEAYLYGSDTVPRREVRTGYRLNTLYANLTAMGARQVAVMLEVDFSGKPGSVMLAPNQPLTGISTLPENASAALSVFTAADSDQRTLVDPQNGCGLFTRHMVAAMSGLADARPLGNGDGVVDSAEAFVYAARKVRLAARKSFGVIQRPRFSFAKPMVLGRVGKRPGK